MFLAIIFVGFVDNILPSNSTFIVFPSVTFSIVAVEASLLEITVLLFINTFSRLQKKWGE